MTLSDCVSLQTWIEIGIGNENETGIGIESGRESESATITITGTVTGIETGTPGIGADEAVTGVRLMTGARQRWIGKRRSNRW